MSHNGTGREPLSRDKRQNKKSLTSQYSFCLGHLVVEAQEINHNFFCIILCLNAYLQILPMLLIEFGFFIIFNEIRKSINSQSESQ